MRNGKLEEKKKYAITKFKEYLEENGISTQCNY